MLNLPVKFCDCCNYYNNILTININTYIPIHIYTVYTLYTNTYIIGLLYFSIII